MGNNSVPGIGLTPIKNTERMGVNEDDSNVANLDKRKKGNIASVIPKKKKKKKQ